MDRTQGDVDNKTDKGFYNATDLNRVASACDEILALMRGVGYSVPMQSWKTWTMFDYPTYANTLQWLNNVYRVINGFYKKNNYSLPIDMSAFTYTQANDIEKALNDINTIIEDIKKRFILSGTFQSGGAVIR